MKTMNLLGIFLLIACQITIGQENDFTEQQIITQQNTRFKAMIEEDVNKLEALLAEDLTYGHTKGSTETKSGFIETVKSKRIDYLSFIPRDVNVRIYDNTALLTGFIDVNVIYNNENLEFTTRFLEVQRKVGDNWLLAAWQPVIYTDRK